MSEENQTTITWKAEIQEFRTNAIKKLTEFNFSDDFKTSLTDLSQKLTALEEEGNKQENASATATADDERKKAVVRHAILEANRIFFHTLNDVANTPSGADEQKWQKMEKVFEAYGAYQAALAESGRLSNVDDYITQLAITCSCKTGLHIACLTGITLLVAMSNTSPIPLIGIFSAWILLALIVDIFAILYEKERLETKMNSANLPNSDAENNDCGSLTSILKSMISMMPQGLLETSAAGLDNFRENIFETPTSVFGEHASERQAGTIVANKLRNTFRPTLGEAITHLTNGSGFWSLPKQPVHESEAQKSLNPASKFF